MLPTDRTYVDRPMVYVAGPYVSPDPVINTRNTVLAAGRLLEIGVTPVVPHLTLLWHLVDPREPNFWYAYDLALLERCDALFRLPGESNGADLEVRFARAAGIPVFTEEPALSAWVHDRIATALEALVPALTQATREARRVK